MNETKITHTNYIETFAKVRACSEAAAKYIRPDGTNEAIVRDTILDIAEEISDAFVLTDLLRQQANHRGLAILSCTEAEAIFQIKSALHMAWDAMIRLNNTALAETQNDEIPVHREIRLGAPWTQQT